jgi:hypothetical protein
VINYDSGSFSLDHVPLRPTFMYSIPVLGLLTCLVALGTYLYLLSIRLNGPNFDEKQVLANEQLDAVEYKHINPLDNVPKQPTSAGYAVIGGSGFVGWSIDSETASLPSI